MVYNFIAIVSYALTVACFGAGLMRLVYGAWPEDTFDSQQDRGISIAAWTGSAFLLGQGVLSQIWLLLALLGCFTPQIVASVLALAALSGLPSVIAPAKKSAMTLVRELQRLRHESWAWRGIAACCLAVLALSGVEGLLLQVPGGKDAAAYYMALPKLTAGTQLLIPLPGSEFVAQLGLVGEMHAAALMALGTDSAAKAFSWPTALAGTFMLLALGSAAGIGRRGQWILIAMVWTSSTVLVHVWDGKVDLYGAAAGVAAYYWVVRATAFQPAAGPGNGPNIGSLRMLGLFTSLAVVSKLTLLVAMTPGLMMLFVWRSLRPPRPLATLGFMVRSLGVIGFSGLTMLIPQLLKNAVLFGEPLAPMVFLFSPHQAQMDGAALTMADARYIFSIYPLALVFGRFSDMGWTLSPLVLMFLPLSAFMPPAAPARSTLVQLTATALLGCVVWHLFRPANFAPRYLLPTLLLFMLAPAAAAEHLLRQESRPRLLAGVVLGCLFFSTLFQVREFFVNDHLLIVLQHAMRGQPAYTVNAEFVRASETINRDAGADERVLLGMHDSYWLRPDLIRALGVDLGPTSAHASLSERWLLAHQQGYRYVLLETNTGPGKRLAAELGIHSDGSVPGMPSGLRVEKLFHEDKCMVLRVDEIR